MKRKLPNLNPFNSVLLSRDAILKETSLYKKVFRLLALLLIFSMSSVYAHITEIRVNQAQDGSLTWYLSSYHSRGECGVANSGLTINGVNYPLEAEYAGDISTLSPNVFATLSGYARTSYAIVHTPFLGTTLSVQPYSSNACWSFLVGGNGTFNPPPPPVCTSAPLTGFTNTVAASGNNNGTFCNPNDDVTTSTIHVSHLACANITGDKQFRVVFDPNGAAVSYGPFNYNSGVLTDVTISIPYGTSNSTMVQVIDDDYPAQITHSLSIPNGQYLGEKELVPPTLSIPSSIITGNSPGICGAVVTYAAPVGSDNCSAVTITQIAGLASGSTFPRGTTTNTFRATDASGNSVTASFTITVNDTEAPAVPLLATITGECSATATAPTTTDNCAGVITGTTSDATTFSSQGNYVITWNFNDGNGNISIARQNVVVKDVTAPTLTGPASAVLSNSPSSCGVAFTYPMPTATDNCSGSAFNFFNGGEPNNAGSEDHLQFYNSGTWNDLNGSAGLLFIVEKNSINTTAMPNYTLIGTFGGHTYFRSNFSQNWYDSRNSAISVGGDLASINTFEEDQFLAPYGGSVWVGGYQDHSDPSYAEPGNSSQNFGGWKWVDGTKLGAGQIAIVQTAGLPSGSVFPLGTTVNTWKATDEAGNSTLYSFNVTVEDHIAPIIVGKPISLVLTASGTVSITPNDVLLSGTDNCGSITYTLSQSTFGASDAINSPVTVQLTGTDASGNATTVAVQVTVIDPVPTVITQNIIVALNAAGQAVITPQQVDNGSSSVVGLAVEGGLTLDKTNFDCSNVGTNTVTLTATSTLGSTASATAIVTVVDNTPPNVLTKNATIQLDAQGKANLAVADINNGSTDNCDISSMVISKTQFGCEDIKGQNFALKFDGVDDRIVSSSSAGLPQGGSARTVEMWINTTQTSVASLHSYGNFASRQRSALYLVSGRLYYVGEFNDSYGGTTLVNDGQWHHIAYTLVGQALKFYIDGQLNYATNLPYYPSTSGTSWAFSNTSQVSYTREPFNGTMDEVRIWNTVRTGAEIANNYQQALSGNEAGLVSYYNFDEGSGSLLTDKTSNHNNGTLTNMNIAQAWVSGQPYISSSNTVTLTVTDIHGNVSTGTAKVTVEDKVAPIVLVQNRTIQLDATGQATITAADINNGSTDNCGIASITLSKTSFDCSNYGANTVTLTVTDIHGNVSTAEATVTVEDNVAPIVLTQNATIQLDGSGIATITAADINNGSTDNCGIASITLSKTTFDCSNYGANTVTLTVTDIHGNVSSAMATVTVEDNVAPIVLVQNRTVQLDGAGNATITAADINNGSTDNCGIASITLSKTSFDCSNYGANTVTLTVTDIHGNVSTAEATVTVEDNVAPVVVVQNLSIPLVNGTASITASQLNNGSTDNCGIASMTIDRASFDCSSIGNHTVTLTVTDIHGNVASRTATVTIVGELTSSSIASVPTGSTYTGGVSTNLYLGYGAQSTTLQVTNLVTGGNGTSPKTYTYAWSGPAVSQLSSSTSGSPVFTPAAAGYYTFNVIVTNKYGCKSASTISICVKDIREIDKKGKYTGKVNICHAPPGNPGNSKTLSVSVNAVESHLREHSYDRLGSCDDAPCSGTTGALANNSTEKPAVERTGITLEVKEAGASKLIAYPNPFAQSTTVSFSVPYLAEKATLDIYDVRGVKIQNLYNNRADAGQTYEVQFNGQNMAAGTYFFRLITSKEVKNFKVIMK